MEDEMLDEDFEISKADIRKMKKKEMKKKKMDGGTTAVQKMQADLVEPKKNLETIREIENRYHIENMTIRKIIDKSLDMLKELSKDSEPDRARAKKKARENIKLVEEKIENCLKLLEEINKSSDHYTDEHEISYKQANIFIYFIETLSLEGVASAKSELKDHFSQYYTENDRLGFSKVRHSLLKSPDKKLGREDIRKFIDGDVKLFFKDLERYVKYIQDVKVLKIFLDDMALELRNQENKLTDVRSFLDQEFKKRFNSEDSKIRQIAVLDYIAKSYPQFKKTDNGTFEKFEAKQIDTFFIKLQKVIGSQRQEKLFSEKFDKKKNMGDDIKIGLKSYVKKQFGELIVAAYTEENITDELLFNYIVNFYPACLNLYSVKELGKLRDNLIHEFHKYGVKKFKEEIHRLRHKLFNYLYAQEVIEVLCDIEADEHPEVINKTLKNKLKCFQDDYINGLKKEYVISTDEAKDFAGYKFSRFLYTATNDDHSGSLVDQCLKFIIIFDHVEKSTSIDNDQDQNSESYNESNALRRREIFEKFNKLIKIDEKKCESYEKKKNDLKSELAKEYEVRPDQFELICSLYVNNSSSFIDETKRKEIENILKSLKKIKVDYNLPNKFLVDLYDQRLKNEDLFRSNESRDFVKDESARLSIIEKFKHLPLDEKTSILKIEKETLSINFGKVISNILNTFYSGYHKYKIEFDIEEIFNDETFINYLVEKETENTKVESLIDRYLKLTLMIDGERREIYEGLQCDELNSKIIRKIFEGFQRLKNLKRHIEEDSSDKKYYEREVEEYKNLVCSYGIEPQNFINFYEYFIEKDCELIDREHGLEMIRSVIIHRGGKLKDYKFTNEEIDFLFEVDMNKNDTFQKVKEFLRVEKIQEVEKIVNIFKTLRESVKKEVNIQIDSKNWNINIWKVADDMLEAFGTKLELKPRNYMIIKKLLKKTDYTAPYIARLLTTVKSDVLIEYDDLLTLLNILLKKEKGLYIKHLNELLMIKSRKLNLYGAVCDIIAEPSFDIDSVELIFEEYQHVKEILSVLIDRIKSEDHSYVELSRKILQILIDSVFKYKPQNNEEALEILNCGLELIGEIRSMSKKRVGQELIESNESKDWTVAYEYDIKLKETKFLIHQAKQLGNVQTESIYKEAQEILREIPDTVQLQSLLASSRYKRNLPKKYKVADDKFNSLYKKIVEFVRGSNDNDTDFNAEEIYTEIEGSKKYKNLLASFSEYRKCPDISKIRKAKYQKALTISSGIVSEIPNVCPHYLLALSREAEVLYFLEKYQEAYKKGEMLCKKIVELVRPDSDASDTDFHTEGIYTEIEESEKYKDLLDLSSDYKKNLNILYISEGVARALLSDGLKEKIKSEADKKCNRALEIYKNVYSHKEVRLGKNHTSTVKDIRYIADAHMRIARFNNTKDNLQNALENATAACIQSCSLFNIQLELYGNYHPAVKKSIKFVVHALDLISVISVKIGATESIENKEKPFYQISKKIYYQICDY